LEIVSKNEYEEQNRKSINKYPADLFDVRKRIY